MLPRTRAQGLLGRAHAATVSQLPLDSRAATFPPRRTAKLYETLVLGRDELIVTLGPVEASLHDVLGLRWQSTVGITLSPIGTRRTSPLTSLLECFLPILDTPNMIKPLFASLIVCQPLAPPPPPSCPLG